MAGKNILGLVGGISKGSLNKKLFHAVQKLSPPGVTLESFDISTLPFFSQDLENDPPAEVIDLKNKIKNADAVLIVTPEYNHSVPGVLKNAIDWASRPPGKGVWEKKWVGIMGASAGNGGTYGAQQHLRAVLSQLDTRTMRKPEFLMNGSKSFDEKGDLIDTKSEEFIKKYWTAFSAWITSEEK